MNLGAISTTVVRVVIPILGAIGGAIGGSIGAFVALAKLMPERAGIIISYQGDVIDDLVSENKRLYGIVADLEVRVKELEDAPPRYLS